MYLCYIDESGVPEISGNTSHFILVGLSIPIWHWKDCDRSVESIKRRYKLENSEIHAAWLNRIYPEQKRIPNFESLSYTERRARVEQIRRAELLRLQRIGNIKLYKQTKKNYRKTESYIHLSHSERQQFCKDVANCISKWGFARLFAECIDKVFFDPNKSSQTIDEQAFEQIISRFEQYLQNISKGDPEKSFGLIIHDNNQTISKRHTELMRQFHKNGTLWTKVKNIIETPLFVDSELTSMVQIADLCAYALRRYLENGEEDLFNLVITRADTLYGTVVGARHFSNQNCSCKICSTHKKL